MPILKEIGKLKFWRQNEKNNKKHSSINNANRTKWM